MVCSALYLLTINRDKLDAKGIESVRRDNCGLVRYVVDIALRKILIDRNINGAIEYVSASLLVLTFQLCQGCDQRFAPKQNRFIFVDYH